MEYKKIIIKTICMVIIGLSALLETKIGIWFIIPWTLGWVIYDYNMQRN